VKVDAARKRGGIKIVWLNWFTDSIALWCRQDETPYLLDDPNAPVLVSSADQKMLPPEADKDDWEEARDNVGPQPSLELGDIDWNDINNEVDAAMNESDDDDVSEEDEGLDETSSVIRSVPSPLVLSTHDR
jgi:RNA polymerase II subunit A C-terminal domain phosphatase